MMDKISTQYNQAVQLIKSAILQNQLEAVKAVNRQMLALYYGVGKYVSDNTRKGAQEPLKRLVNSLGENCLYCAALACPTLKTCDNFMNHGTSL